MAAKYSRPLSAILNSVVLQPAEQRHERGLRQDVQARLRLPVGSAGCQDGPEQLPAWFEEYNEWAPQKGLRMKSSRQFRRPNLSA